MITELETQKYIDYISSISPLDFVDWVKSKTNAYLFFAEENVHANILTEYLLSTGLQCEVYTNCISINESIIEITDCMLPTSATWLLDFCNMPSSKLECGNSKVGKLPNRPTKKHTLDCLYKSAKDWFRFPADEQLSIFNKGSVTS